VRADGTLTGLLGGTAALRPAQTALIDGGERISYAELEERCARFAGLLRAHGVEPGDRVAVLLPNEAAFVEAAYGAWRLGATVVPFSPLLRAREIELRLTHAGAAVFVTAPEQAAALDMRAELVDPAAARDADPARIVATEPGDIALLLYTSGTTGEPKAAELTHHGLHAVATNLATAFELGPDDVVLGAAPLAHVLGQGAVNMAVAAGSAVALVRRFDPADALELLERTGTTIFLGVPTMCLELLRLAEGAASVPHLRVAHVGGAPLAPETLHAFAARFGCAVLEGYGMTETAGTLTTHRLGRPVKPGSVGEPVAGVEVRIAEDGEVLVRGPGVMRGYRGDPEATRATLSADGWLATGDVGRLDEDGYLTLLDRKKDVILRGGYTIYPREIEEVLYAHYDVQEAVVVGVPHPSLGEEVVAIVVPRSPDCDAAAVQAFVRERVAAYKYPRLVVLRDALPHGASGKIQRREIDRAALARLLSP